MGDEDLFVGELACPLCGDAFCFGPIVTSGPAGRLISVPAGCEGSPAHWQRLWESYSWVPPCMENEGRA